MARTAKKVDLSRIGLGVVPQQRADVRLPNPSLVRGERVHVDEIAYVCFALLLPGLTELFEPLPEALPFPLKERAALCGSPVEHVILPVEKILRKPPKPQ